MKCPKCSHEIDVPNGNCVFCGYTPTMEDILKSIKTFKLFPEEEKKKGFKMDNKVVFIVESHGDPSVGISGFTARVTIDDSLGYDKEDIKAMKKMIANHYDEPVANVYTEAEWKAFLKAEREMYKQMSEEQKEGEKLMAEHYEHCSGCAACEYQE